MVASRERELIINAGFGICIFHTGVHTHSTGTANECEKHWKKKEKQTTENIFLFFVVARPFSSSCRIKVFYCRNFVFQAYFKFLASLKKLINFFAQNTKCAKMVRKNIKKNVVNFKTLFNFFEFIFLRHS